MRSRTGFFAAMVLLLALPVTVLYQMLFGNGADTVVHVVLGLGSLLLASAVFDFTKVAKRITWTASFAAAAEGTIFLLQGLSHLIQNAEFSDFVYQRLGQWPERLFMDLILFWCVALWLTEGESKTRLVGLFALIGAVGLEAYSYILSYLGSSINTAAPGLKLLYLLPFVWLLLESSKKISPVHSLKLSVQQKEIL